MTEDPEETSVPVGASQWLGEYRRQWRGDGDGQSDPDPEAERLQYPGRLGD